MKFGQAPVQNNDKTHLQAVRKFAETYVNDHPMGFHVNLDVTRIRDLEDLKRQCSKHAIMDVYLWLHLRFPSNFVEPEEVWASKEYLIGEINETIKRKASTLEVR